MNLFRCFILPYVLWVSVVAQEAKPPTADYATMVLLDCDRLPLASSVAIPCEVAVEGAVLADGRFGKCLDFRAAGEASFRCPMAAQPDQELTLECWVWLNGDSEDRLQRIVGRGSNYGFYLSNRGRRLTWFVMAGEWKSVGGQLPLQTWVHLAGTYDGKVQKLYIDGKLAGEEENPGRVEQRDQPYYFGAEIGRGMRFNGLIDEVRLSNVARTSFMTGQPLAEPEPSTTLVPKEISSDAFAAAMTVVKSNAEIVVDGTFDEPSWERLPPAAFVKTKDAGRPDSPTSIRVAYDDANLYLAYVCQEKGQESQRPGPGGFGDMALFKTDAVEALLQPGGSGAPYFQLAMNPAGGLVAIKYAAPGRRADWTPEGIQIAGVVHADYWTVEAAIPFAALGVPAPAVDGSWRANFCRNEVPAKELSAWSFTGGGFHVLKYFGVLSFASALQIPAEGDDAAGGVCELRGVVQDSLGRPLSGVPVKSAVGLVRTNILGAFRMSGLPKGAAAIEINTPQCERISGTVELKRTVERLAPIALKAVDPYRPAYAEAPGDGFVSWFSSSICEPPDMEHAPAAETAASDLVLAAAPGEYESRALAFFCRVDLHQPVARIESLTSEDGASIPSENIDVRWTQRLLKRVQYTRPREDAVWTWRFLWREPPERVASGHMRQLVVTVKPPAGTPAGRYRGTLALSADGTPVADLPVALDVVPFELADPGKVVGVYYGVRGPDDEQIARELNDIREHGGSVLIWHSSVWYSKDEEGRVVRDFSQVKHAVQMQQKAGLGPPYLVGTNPRRLAAMIGIKVRMTPECAQELLDSQDFKREYKETVKQLDALEGELGAGEFLYTWMDEIFNQGRYEFWEAVARLTREASDHRIYVTFHNRDQSMVDRIAPWVDVRCYHGHTLDAWQEQGHTWKELEDEIKNDGDTAWNYYNIREIAVTSEWVRLCNGYWLWRSPLDGHVPWKYYSYGGSPFDDMDSDRHDFAYAAPHPSKPEMVSSLEWEAFREGYDDMRYIAALKRELTAATAAGRAPGAVKAAEALLASWWNAETRVPAMADALTGQDYLKRRQAIIDLIARLRQ